MLNRDTNIIILEAGKNMTVIAQAYAEIQYVKYLRVILRVRQ